MRQCISKWEKVEAQKPVRERRPVPQPPQNFNAVVTKSKVVKANNIFDFYNEEAFTQFNKMALVPCGCGRTFLPDSLAKHQKTCMSASGNGAAAVSATL